MKFCFKIYLKDGTQADPHQFFKVFSSWVPESPEVFVDVADYRHVNDGPLTCLVGHYADYYLDATERREGLFYQRKNTPPSDDAIADSFRQLIAKAQKLQADDTFKGELQFATNEFLFLINDRALAPNTAETFEQFKPQLEAAMTQAFGEDGFSLTHNNDPRKRFSVTVKVNKEIALDSLPSN